MLIQAKPPLHLTYCLNVHPGEGADDVLRALREHTLAVRERVAPGRSFGVGLRLGAQASAEFGDRTRLDSLIAVLAAHDLYAFTINAFPYGRFHAGPVKERVYQPDWTTPERRNYTRQVADELTALLPRGAEGSLSTVPVGGPGRLSPEAERRAVAHLVDLVAHLEELSFRRGQDLHVGLEPEPGCHLETTAQTIDFLKLVRREGESRLGSRLGLRRGQAEEILRQRLGVCFDTCHVALQFEDPAWAWDRYRSEGVRISKLQISAALACDATPESRDALTAFAEPVYLHQTHAQRGTGSIWRWVDLPDALAAWPELQAEQEVRVHFHVPLCWTGAGTLRSTTADLTPLFWDRVRRGTCSHLEIETYTYDVLPLDLRRSTVAESIAAEFAWVRRQLVSNG